MAHALQQVDSQQLTLDARWSRPARVEARRHAEAKPLCAWCRGKEARYGFREHPEDPLEERPRALCFECFRIEITRRQAVAARLARGWNGAQTRLPLEETLKALTHRRRRAQIAARHAMGE
jgi:hypothetical protein